MRPNIQQKPLEIEKINYAERGEIVSLSEEEVQLTNFAKTIKETKYRLGSNSRLCGNLTQIEIHLKSAELGISMTIRSRSVGRCINPSVPFVESTCI